MKGIHNNKLIRPIFMKALKILDFDISIKHHWTSLTFKLNLFKQGLLVSRKKEREFNHETFRQSNRYRRYCC